MTDESHNGRIDHPKIREGYSGISIITKIRSRDPTRMEIPRLSEKGEMNYKSRDDGKDGSEVEEGTCSG